MKYIVLHRVGSTWQNAYGNSLHVPFIEADTEDEAVEIAEEKAGESLDGFLVFDVADGIHMMATTTWVKTRMGDR